MFFRVIYLLITVLLFNSVCVSGEYNIPVDSHHPPKCTPLHWRHFATNSAIDIGGIEIDVFQWRAAAENRESIQVKILNPNWEFANWADNNFILPEEIEISTVLNFRGTPIVHIRVTPWRIMDGRIEMLTHGTIQISVNPVNFPITFNHPYLLNSEKPRLKRTFTDNPNYLIISPILFKEAAESLQKMHMYEVDEKYRLNTEVLFCEHISSNITGNKLRDTIIHRINDDLDFLLLFGDEIDIPPIYNGQYPSDDFYTTSGENIYSGDPQLFSGRIPVSNLEDALTVVEKIRNYTLSPTTGIWRSKVALVADDMLYNPSCTYTAGESSHTLKSDDIYTSLKTFLPLQPFYGVDYGLQPSGSGCTYPDLTDDLIRTINNGVALVNYIGHGDYNTWADEKLLSKSRDLPLIHVDSNKLAIWVAGTCSFGQYNGKNSFMEALLFKEDGAIAVVATTDEIGYDPNWQFIENLFGISNNVGIEDFINNKVDFRLGQLVWNAKNVMDNLNDYYKFHTFGDPALRMPFPKISDKIIINPPNEIPLVEEGNITVKRISANSTLLIRGNDEIYTDYGAVYTIPGATYTQVDFQDSSTCFRIPLDAGGCENCAVIQVYQDESGKKGQIQLIPEVSIINSFITSQDNEGPKIEITQNNNAISNGSAILTNTGLKITLHDSSGINLMETIGHGIQYKYDDDDLTLLPGSEFIGEDCSMGHVNIPVPSTLFEGLHHFYLETWDGVNNKSIANMDLEILGNSSSSPLFLYKIYPFPNPFSESTEFTMFVSNPPASITITVYSLMGEKVKELDKYKAENSFISIPWDGKDDAERKIANGAYFYHVKAEKDGKIMLEDIYKLAKVE